MLQNAVFSSVYDSVYTAYPFYVTFYNPSTFIQL